MKKINLYVVMLLCAILLSFTSTSNVNAAKLSKAEKKHYSKILKKGIKDDRYIDSLKNSLLNARFVVYDINGDRHKDVIVSGSYGMRTMSSSEIYMHVDGKYQVIPILGTLKGVSSKGINAVYEDYEGSGEKRYYRRAAYKFDKHGNIITLNSYSTEKLFYDRSTAKIYKKGKILSREYNDKDGNSISKSVYKKTLKQTNKRKNIKMHPLTKANIKKYIK